MAAKTAGFSPSGTRFRTQLLMTQSMELEARGRLLMVEWMKDTLEVWALRAFLRARVIIS